MVSSARSRRGPTFLGGKVKATFVLFFLALVAGKAIVVWSQSAGGDLMESALAAALYAFFFGLPQLLCLAVVANKVMTARHAVEAASAMLVFMLTAWYFGSLLGTQAPAWGGDGHFEVPVQFLTELIVAAAFAITYPRLSRETK